MLLIFHVPPFEKRWQKANEQKTKVWKINRQNHFPSTLFKACSFFAFDISSCSLLLPGMHLTPFPRLTILHLHQCVRIASKWELYINSVEWTRMHMHTFIWVLHPPAIAEFFFFFFFTFSNTLLGIETPLEILKM